MHLTRPSKELKATWYQKLKDEGFNDIENAATGQLKVSHSTQFNRAYDPQLLLHKQEYYYQAQHFATRYEFKDSVDKQIWTMHAQGKPMRTIATTVCMSLGKVHHIITFYRAQIRWCSILS